jgi:hypothetical protein
LLHFTPDPRPWKEDPAELPEHVIRFRQVHQQVLPAELQLQVPQPLQGGQQDAREVGEIVKVQNESHASTNTQPVRKYNPQPKEKKPTQVPRPTRLTKAHSKVSSRMVPHAKMELQSIAPIPVFAPAAIAMATAAPAASPQKPNVSPRPVEGTAQLDAVQQPMEEDWEGWRGAGDVDMNQGEDEWEKFGDQDNVE